MTTKQKWAYIIGVALGDGNLSNSNGRAIRLRITCDARYPRLAREITDVLQAVLPNNSVAIVRVPGKNTYFNISVYSNKLGNWIPWRVGKGTKEMQKVRVPRWIRSSKIFSWHCVRGLLQTDGSIYFDRGYQMINFTNNVKVLAKDVMQMLIMLGFQPRLSTTANPSGTTKYTVRVARNPDELIRKLKLFKA